MSGKESRLYKSRLGWDLARFEDMFDVNANIVQDPYTKLHFRHNVVTPAFMVRSCHRPQFTSCLPSNDPCSTKELFPS